MHIVNPIATTKLIEQRGTAKWSNRGEKLQHWEIYSTHKKAIKEEKKGKRRTFKTKK